MANQRQLRAAAKALRGDGLDDAADDFDTHADILARTQALKVDPEGRTDDEKIRVSYDIRTAPLDTVRAALEGRPEQSAADALALLGDVVVAEIVDDE